MKLTASPVPQNALLQRYVGRGSTYTDCFSVEVPQSVTLERFITAFYTSRLFRLERAVLRLALRRSISDREIAPFLAGHIDQFAAWTIEASSPDQLLLSDVSAATRSWFCVRHLSSHATLLSFGSAVVLPAETMPFWVRMTLPAHRFYSRMLLRGAVRRLACESP